MKSRPAASASLGQSLGPRWPGLGVLPGPCPASFRLSSAFLSEAFPPGPRPPLARHDLAAVARLTHEHPILLVSPVPSLPGLPGGLGKVPQLLWLPPSPPPGPRAGARGASGPQAPSLVVHSFFPGSAGWLVHRARRSSWRSSSSRRRRCRWNRCRWRQRHRRKVQPTPTETEC